MKPGTRSSDRVSFVASDCPKTVIDPEKSAGGAESENHPIREHLRYLDQDYRFILNVTRAVLVSASDRAQGDQTSARGFLLDFQGQIPDIHDKAVHVKHPDGWIVLNQFL